MPIKYCDQGKHPCEKLWRARTKTVPSACQLHKDLPYEGSKQKVSISPISDSQVIRLAKYRKLRDAYMAEHKVCEAGFVGCTIKAVDLHHSFGKIGENLFTGFKALCRACHRIAEENPLLAKEKGISKDRL